MKNKSEDMAKFKLVAAYTVSEIMQDVIPMDPSVGRIANDDTLKRIY